VKGTGSAGACPPVSSQVPVPLYPRRCLSPCILRRCQPPWILRLIDALGLARFLLQAPPAAATEEALFNNDCDKKYYEKKKDYSEKLEHAVRTPSLLSASIIVNSYLRCLYANLIYFPIRFK
jgi:hypothetical protein